MFLSPRRETNPQSYDGRVEVTNVYTLSIYAYTWANKACQGKTCQLCCTHEQIKLAKGKLVNLCCTHEQIKLVMGKLVNLCCTHEQIKLVKGNTCQFMLYTRANKACQGEYLSRKTWSSVRCLSRHQMLPRISLHHRPLHRIDWFEFLLLLQISNGYCPRVELLKLT